MESNLNQFRLFTVTSGAEQAKAGDRSRGRASTYGLPRLDCGGGGAGLNNSPQGEGVMRARTSSTSNRPGCRSEGVVEADRKAGQTPPQCRQMFAPKQQSMTDEANANQRRKTEDDDDEDDESDDEEDDFHTVAGDVAADMSDTDTESEKTLVRALISLEKTVSAHCLLMNKKFPKDRSMPKTVTSDATARSPVVTVLPKAATRTDKVTLYIRVVFLKIGEIDTMKENFMADAFIQARWREPTLDGHAVASPEEIEWEKYWNPKLYVENSLGEPKETVWQTMILNASGEAMVYERRRIKGCFLENLELGEFPFDTQDLTLTVSTERSDMEVELEEDNSEISSINVQSFVDEQEWKLHSHVETWKKVTTRIYQNSKFRHPSFSTSCRASRRPGFFIWNIFLVMLFICSLTFSTFSVELTKPENRLQLSFILLLTTITFKFVVSQTLPRISYLTYLDKYILTSMGILCGVCVWHAIVPMLNKDDPERARLADRWGLIVSGSSYFLFHVCFFMYIYFVAMRKRWIYEQKDREHKERMKKLQRLQEIGNATTTIVDANEQVPV